jgi:hypothetical protein
MGEEFNATRRNTPLPIEGGHRLSSQWLSWEDLAQPESRAFLQDARKILGVRRSNRDILNYERSNSYLKALEFATDGDHLPTPYARYVPGRAEVIVVGNPTPDHVAFQIAVPVDELGIGGAEIYSVTDLWSRETSVLPRSEVESLTTAVPGDATPGDGVRAIRVEPTGRGGETPSAEEEK